MDSNPLDATLLHLVGGVFILIGLVFVPVAWRVLRTRLAAQQWPPAVATLRDVEVVRHVRERDADEHHRLLVSHACVLHYEYRVDGRTYQASHGLPARDQAHALELAAQQVPGSQRTLYHDPQAPERHQVERPAPLGALLWLLPGVAFAGFGLLVIAMA